MCRYEEVHYTLCSHIGIYACRCFHASDIFNGSSTPKPPLCKINTAGHTLHFDSHCRPSCCADAQTELDLQISSTRRRVRHLQLNLRRSRNPDPLALLDIEKFENDLVNLEREKARTMDSCTRACSICPYEDLEKGKMREEAICILKITAPASSKSYKKSWPHNYRPGSKVAVTWGILSLPLQQPGIKRADWDSSYGKEKEQGKAKLLGFDERRDGLLVEMSVESIHSRNPEPAPAPPSISLSTTKVKVIPTGKKSNQYSDEYLRWEPEYLESLEMVTRGMAIDFHTTPPPPGPLPIPPKNAARRYHEFALGEPMIGRYEFDCETERE